MRRTLKSLAQTRDKARNVSVVARCEDVEVRPREERLAPVLGEPPRVGAVQVVQRTRPRQVGGNAPDLTEPGHVLLAKGLGGISDATDQLPAAADNVIE